MDKQLIKIGLLKTEGDPIHRHSIANFVEWAEKNKPWRVYPMEVFYEMELVKKWYVPTEDEVKAHERDFKAKFTITQKVDKDANGRSEIREVSEQQLKDYIEPFDTLYPLQEYPKKYAVLYVCKCILRPEPLPIPQILIDNYRSTWKP